MEKIKLNINPKVLNINKTLLQVTKLNKIKNSPTKFIVPGKLKFDNK